MAITHIKLNGLVTPMGYEPAPMLLSWLVEGEHGRTQTHAQVEVFAGSLAGQRVYTAQGDLDWQGTPLEFTPAPRTRYLVRLQVTDDAGALHTGESWFETGKLDEPWQGRWISPAGEPACAPTLTGAFALPAPPVRARLYMVGLGVYTARLNGEPVTAEALNPGVWDYEESVQYQSYDVTGLLAPGDNALAVTLGRGWYLGRFGLHATAPFGARYALLAELRVTLEGGEELLFTSGPDWRWQESDVAGDNGIYDGESLDRLRWADSTPPQGPVEVMEPPLQVVERLTPPVGVVSILPVEQVITTPAGETVLDFGQNHAGWLRFHAHLPRGTRVRFLFGEVLQNGNFYNENYRSATGGFTYRSDGREETVCQRFTFYGFRYVKVEGWPGRLNPADFESPVLSCQLERTAWLTCGHEGLERLYHNVLWGQWSNFLSIPTDCPQRDERLGWTGDAQVFAPTACYNMDCRAFYRAFLRFLRREQLRHGGEVPTYVPSHGDFTSCAIWSDAAALIPQTLLDFSGSTAQVAEHYELMKDWVDWVSAHNPGGLYTRGFQFGDWLAQDGITPQSFKGGTDDVFLASAFRMESARITAQLAHRLGREEEAEGYRALAGQVRQAVLDAYFTPAGRLSVDTQAAYITALRFGLWRDKEVLLEQLRRRLRYDGYAIRCGFAGAPLFCSVLAQHGMGDLACELLLRKGFPGWMYAVDLGATTVWERWNSLLSDGACSGTGMNSLNHYAYGSVMEYVYGHLAGLRPGAHGFRDAQIAPQPDIRLGWLDLRCHTPAGSYACAWQIQEDGTLHIHLEVPFGCAATLTLPDSGREPFPVEAGSYDYHYMPQRDYRRPYTPATRLSALAWDERAQAILAREAPVLLAMLKEDNREFTTQTLEELGHAFFLGLTPEKLAPLLEQLSALQICPAKKPE